MAPRDDPESVLDPLTERVDVGVEFFTLLSGFLTHLTYSGEDLLSTAGSLVHFWARRAGRAVAVAQLAMLAAAALDGLAGIPVLSWRLLGCLCFARPWFSPAPDCPNMPVWYLAALLPSWMLYPFVLQPVLCAAAHWRPWRLGLLLLAAWAAAIGPQLAVIAWNGGWMSWNQVVRTWFWPPAQLADFALGATAAAVRLRWPPPPASGPAGDAAVAALLLACLLAPPAAEPPPDWGAPPAWRSSHYAGWGQLLARLSAPASLLWIYGSGGGRSRMARLLAHPALSSLGAYSMEVYLFQVPLHTCLLWLREPSSCCGPVRIWRGLPASTKPFLLFLALLWLLAGLFVELAAEPASRALRRATAGLRGRPLWSLLDGTSESDYTVVSDESAPDSAG